MDLWPPDFDLATAGISLLPGGAQEFLRGIKVPVVRLVPIPDAQPPNPAALNANNGKKFEALWKILFPKQHVCG